jgi:hypothetical protein
MKYIITFIKRILPKEIPRPIGRWRIEQCNKKMNNKIDLSNEDHCGPCGQYALEKIESINNKPKITQIKKPNE